MMTKTGRVALAMLIGCGAATALQAARPTAPLAVSPGSGSRETLEESRCPTFSWSGVPTARGYELTVYRIGGDGSEVEVVLRHRLPALVSSWTPSLDRCLERGRRYAWSVRALGRKTESRGSAPSLFRIAPPAEPAAVHGMPGSPAEEDAAGLPAGARPTPFGTGRPAAALGGASAGPGGSAAEPAGPGAGTPIADTVGLLSEVSETDVKGIAVVAVTASRQNESAGVWGRSTATTGSTAGLVGECWYPANPSCSGVKGFSSEGVGVTGESIFGSGVVGWGAFGVWGSTSEAGGQGVSGHASAPDGVGVFGESLDALGYAGVFVNTGSGLLLVADNDSEFWTDPEFKVEGDGTAHARAFVGDGSGLANLGVRVVAHYEEANNNSSDELSSSCASGESLVGGACDCWASSVWKSHPTASTDGWQCVCNAYGSRSAWAFCLDVP